MRSASFQNMFKTLPMTLFRRIAVFLLSKTNIVVPDDMMLQDAASAAKEGETILLRKGCHKLGKVKPIKLQKSLTIIGDTIDSTCDGLDHVSSQRIHQDHPVCDDRPQWKAKVSGEVL
eukprot:gnl/MRDRNA2_/MRDRNA2_149216_c0_seq1.p1 gnl/MRDRNA2_/MRDRNA2_149216_c0~~gnl/MRDRNA2_/MRDRNA2_149216_c0_seq1.p1  ORF type:complete len:134 (+),score=15.22 gnl/MRDRNA2_/MRDRNA2_149216_c0_seq1:51-404(+)